MGMKESNDNKLKYTEVKPQVGTEGTYLCVGFLLVLVSLGFLLVGNVYG